MVDRAGGGRTRVIAGPARDARMPAITVVQRLSGSEVREPDRDLALRGLGGVGAVDHVLDVAGAPVAAQVAADGAGRGLGVPGGAGQGTEAGDDLVADFTQALESI